MNLEQREKNLSPQCKAIWKLLKRGHKINPMMILNQVDSMKCSTRCGEVERGLGVTLQKKMIGLPSGKRVMQYWWRP